MIEGDTPRNMYNTVLRAIGWGGGGVRPLCPTRSRQCSADRASRRRPIQAHALPPKPSVTFSSCGVVLLPAWPQTAPHPPFAVSASLPPRPRPRPEPTKRIEANPFRPVSSGKHNRRPKSPRRPDLPLYLEQNAKMEHKHEM